MVHGLGTVKRISLQLAFSAFTHVHISQLQFLLMRTLFFFPVPLPQFLSLSHSSRHSPTVPVPLPQFMFLSRCSCPSETVPIPFQTVPVPLPQFLSLSNSFYSSLAVYVPSKPFLPLFLSSSPPRAVPVPRRLFLSLSHCSCPFQVVPVPLSQLLSIPNSSCSLKLFRSLTTNFCLTQQFLSLLTVHVAPNSHCLCSSLAVPVPPKQFL